MVSIFDLQDLYKTYFNKSPYYITPKGSEKPVTQDIVYSGIAQNSNSKGTIYYTDSQHQPLNKIGAYGQDIWFPIEFWKSTEKVLEIEGLT
ncbi:hypothetical protein LVDJXP189_790016 [Flavobacterium psychrophilum]|uniref:hypothetical protein n=1 Tax=Flavobacterium psychrophilum TaxID=96345 RepID=UPI000B7C3857|nr:hypothetical protein [Flavobacterium psychrophilum]SNB44112.1 hypothetical protein LVDJXP189_790016 [Flavobacterium psychrophilum]